MQMDRMAEIDSRDWISAPAVTLLAQLRRREVPASLVGAALDGGVGQLRALLDGSEPIDLMTAEVLGSLLGGGCEFWLRRQANYDAQLDQAVRRLTNDEVNELLRRAPVPNRSNSKKISDRTNELRRRLAFYGVGSAVEWERRYGGKHGNVVFRTSGTFPSREGPTSLWLRRGEIAAAMIETSAWDRSGVLASIPAVRKLTKFRQLDRCLPALRSLLAQVGIALVIQRSGDGCRASGAARFVEPGKAMLLLSLRYRSDDHLWFTVFHELGHLVLHSGAAFVDEDDTPGDQREVEADKFAAEAIIPPDREDEFRSLSLQHRQVTRFAVSLGVAPGLIVGQLQHRGLLARDKLNFLKRRFEIAEVDRIAATL